MARPNKRILRLYERTKMGLKIRNRKTEKLARELANLTGETVPVAVTEALREKLERVRSEQGATLTERLMMIGKDCFAHLAEPSRTADHAEMLYDERGLPK